VDSPAAPAIWPAVSLEQCAVEKIGESISKIHSEHPDRLSPMTPVDAPSITIGELEANYHLYCKALKMLVNEGRSNKKIQRTVCWDRLAILHNCLPRRYKPPAYLLACLQREWQSAQEPCSGEVAPAQ